jgi:hypothetical protein
LSTFPSTYRVTTISIGLPLWLVLSTALLALLGLLALPPNPVLAQDRLRIVLEIDRRRSAITWGGA